MIDDEARVRVVFIRRESISALLETGNKIRCVEGLPPGARLVRTFEEAEFSVPRYGLVFKHESFAPLDDGQRIPELQVLFETLE